MAKLELSSSALFRIGFFVELGLVLVAAAIGALLLEAPFPFAIQLSGWDCLLGVAATVPPAIGAAFLTSPFGRKIRSLELIYERVKLVLGTPVRGLTLLEIFLLSAAAGIGEEVLFRGVLQNEQVAGLVVTSIAFGLLHALTPAYFILASLMGLYLGWLMIATGNLMVPIIVHWLYDALALHLLRVRFDQDADRDEEERKKKEEEDLDDIEDPNDWDSES